MGTNEDVQLGSGRGRSLSLKVHRLSGQRRKQPVQERRRSLLLNPVILLQDGGIISNLEA